MEKKFFTLAEFNLEFDYGYTEVADKPIPITTQHLRSETSKHLRQGSAQTWLLARLLPLLIASSIPENDYHWQCYLKLLKIIDICLALSVTTDRAWTMQYEAKLRILKCGGHVSNYKNITQTISHRHQRLMCYEFSAGGVF